MDRLLIYQMAIDALQEASVLKDHLQNTELREKAIQGLESLMILDKPKKVREFRTSSWQMRPVMKCTICGEEFRTQHSAHFHENHPCEISKCLKL